MSSSAQLASRNQAMPTEERRIRVELYRRREFACWRSGLARLERARSLFHDAALLAAEWVFKPASMRVLTEALAVTTTILVHAEVAEHPEARGG